jgi:Uma2 family endonuclease
MSAVLELVKPQIKQQARIHRDVSWDEYEELLTAYSGKSFPRFNYSDGVLEIVMPNSIPHEEENRTLARLFELIAVELEIDFRGLGSATLKNKNVKRGVEPDSCFYIQSVEKIEGKRDFALDEAPPPDLIIEADVTSSSLPRFPIFAALQVPEVWRYDSKDEQVRFYKLEKQKYAEVKNSLALPVLTGEKATEFLQDSRTLSSTAWARKVRDWVAKETA